MTPFKGSFRTGDSGFDCAAVKRALSELGFGKGIVFSRKFGKVAATDLGNFQHAHGLTADRVYGPATHKRLEPHFTPFARWLYKKAKPRVHSKQIPPLPRFLSPRLLSVDTGPTRFEWGVQNWIVPQVEAICKEFGLTVTAGYGGHPPHAYYSDHRVGLAVDLAGPLTNMQACNLWADGLRGHTFRWVGGPAHDADGVEAGHYNHCHLSWYRTHATTIFGTSKFR